LQYNINTHGVLEKGAQCTHAQLSCAD